MRILHVCLSSFYNDNYSYQENILPKYHKADGNDVYILSSIFALDENGKSKYFPGATTYINEHGIEVSRIEYVYNIPLFHTLRLYKNTYETIEKYAPDIIFIHNIQFLDIKEIVRYIKKHPHVRVYADNHCDFFNSASTWISKNILHKIIWKHCAKLIEPYVTKFYGVLPARVDFLKDVYGMPQNKVELLVMGADDEKVYEAKGGNFRKTIREKYGVKDDEFLIITGGKIDFNKPETLTLMSAVQSLGKKVKLLLFGSVVAGLKEEFDRLIKHENIIYIGWINSSDVYKYFAASDLGFFPGKHSVLWEQAIGMGLPCVFRKIEGFTHVDIGGNCVFIDNADEQSLINMIRAISSDKPFYRKMLSAAQEKGMKEFSYKDISKRSIIKGV
ncbi:MAG: glycosyltransferase family 4 protein [Ruminococcaceae bacterium]|nr:glycosyltransferase family 4 protein [Oscillospiraceae bacterium]